jgi:arginyl-tRNA synthetase
MLTVEKLLEARQLIQVLQEKQDKVYSELCDEVSKRHKAEYPDLGIMLEDFCYNHIYYPGKDISKFIKDLHSKEIILEM